MLVKELIERLQKVNGEKEIRIDVNELSIFPHIDEVVEDSGDDGEVRIECHIC